MSLGGKAHSTRQAASGMPEESAQGGARRDEVVRAQVRAHVRQVLLQAGPRASAERD
jgi:hypothetical protein